MDTYDEADGKPRPEDRSESDTDTRTNEERRTETYHLVLQWPFQCWPTSRCIRLADCRTSRHSTAGRGGLTVIAISPDVLVALEPG
jgi:hypothetical protein